MNLLIERLPQLLTLVEEYRPVVGYEDSYEVSNTGKVRSVDRIDSLGRIWKGRELRPNRVKEGHLQACFSQDGKRKNLLVHRLVVETFRGEIAEGLVVRHITDVPDQNWLPLLEIGTPKENTADKVQNGRCYLTEVKGSKTKCPRGHDITSPLNIPPSKLEKGERECLACNRAKNYNRDNKLGLAGDSPEFRDLADEYYRATLAGFTSPKKFYAAVAATVTS